MGMETRQLTADDWAELRAVRLEALADTPSAFGSTLARELAFDEERWRGWPVKHGLFMTWVDGEPVAIAGGIPEPGGVELVAVWASPASRGTGAGAAVVQAVIDWARDREAKRVTAWAVEDNERALRFYRKLGFTLTGRDDVHPHDARLRELEMELSLRA
ncbi:N-acetyltransferase family protein [Actinokineospora sp. HUAS TT18]|uniref:GNAT family N-acetyltransferase n=1 Tax=Actinokineospora sp. HUAS TT18 TaxID=3447451 RepID=UPI003F51ED45